ncbi:hypothetical protein GC088_03215 [Arthrobacter sp. JZ12]|uniref:hypothetical protein n=1 Tax=Arthrobacter sp. JZ12 TaxID=2654190 RepID=UPI002B493BAC|nr:hypothetical protein [Arthrobacter sp. JZ12]WRH24203.1 hypothetical protein GC088_03215 [Arthrobacter sp. JZ12]
MIDGHTFAQAAQTDPQPDISILSGVALVLFLACLGGAIKAVHLRGSTVKRLRDDVDLAFEGLTERVFQSLRVLRDAIVEILPHDDVTFDPLALIMDPSRVEQPAATSVRLLRERHHIRKQYRHLLNICSLLKYSTSIMTLLIATTTAAYYLAFQHAMFWRFSLVLTAVCAAVTLFAYLAYAHLETRIQAGIEDANPVEDFTEGNTS